MIRGGWGGWRERLEKSMGWKAWKETEKSKKKIPPIGSI